MCIYVILQVLQTAGLLASQMSYTLEIPISRARVGREDKKPPSASPTAQVRGEGGRREGREEGKPGRREGREEGKPGRREGRDGGTQGGGKAVLQPLSYFTGAEMLEHRMTANMNNLSCS